MAQRIFDRIVSDAQLLASITGGQAHNIDKMSEELESLRRMNDRQADTIAKLQGVLPASMYAKLGVSSYNGLMNRIGDLLKKESELRAQPSQSSMERLQREAAFGRKMAAYAGVNIA